MRAILLFTLFLMSLYGVDATLKIEKDVDQRAKIEIIDSSDFPSSKSAIVADILKKDMKISGHFLIEPTKANYTLKFKYFEGVSGASLNINIIEKSSSQTIFRGNYKIPIVSRYPFLVHKAVTEINRALGFDSISWINNYIVYSRYLGKKSSVITLADISFHYKKDIIKGGLSLFPAWGDKSQKILYYTDYNGELPILKRVNLRTGEVTTLLHSQGMLVCSDSSSDGKRLLLTMAPEGQPDIYEYDTTTNSLKKLTFFRGIDVNGHYSGGKKRLIFVSNRLGNPNIFAKDLYSRDVEQLVFGGKNNNSCDTNEDKVVFVGRDNPQTYNIYLMNSDGSGIRPLSSGGVNQYPKFSPDGSVVMYLNRDINGYSAIFVNLESGERIQFPMNVSRIQSIDW